MKKFNVYFRTGAFTRIEIEVDDDFDITNMEHEDELIEKAWQDLPSLCSHCSGFGSQPAIDLCDWEQDGEPELQE